MTSLRTGSNSGRRQPTQRQLDALKPGQFRPGQSGCPGGRPKTKPITDMLRQMLDEPYKGKEKRFQGLTNVRALAERTYELAIAGSLPAIQFIADRVEGKVAERQEWGGVDGDPILWAGYASREEAEQRLHFLLAKAGLTNSSTGEKNGDHVN